MMTAAKGRTQMVEMTTGNLDELRAVMRLPRLPSNATAADRLTLLHEEAALRDQIVEFTYALDAADIDAVMSIYSKDCTVINPRGRYVGHDEIRANYVRYYEMFPWLRHVFANIGFRFPNGFDDGYATMFQSHVALNVPVEQVAEAGDSAYANAASSTDIWRIVKSDGVWKIAERTIHYDPRLYQKLPLLELD